MGGEGSEALALGHFGGKELEPPAQRVRRGSKTRMCARTRPRPIQRTPAAWAPPKGRRGQESLTSPRPPGAPPPPGGTRRPQGRSSQQQFVLSTPGQAAGPEPPDPKAALPKRRLPDCLRGPRVLASALSLPPPRKLWMRCQVLPGGFWPPRRSQPH